MGWRDRRGWRFALIAAVLAVGRAAPAAPDYSLRGIDYDTGDLYGIDQNHVGIDGNLLMDIVGSTGVRGLCGLERNPANGFLYGFTSGAASKLYKIDAGTAVTTEIGALDIGFVFEGSLVFGPNGTAYGCNAGDAENPVFFTLNLNTGAATRVDTIGGLAHDVNGMAFRSDGKIAALDRETSRLLIMNATNGFITDFFNLPIDVGEVGGMTVLGDVAYLSTSGPGGIFPGSNTLYVINLMNGAMSPVGSMQLGFDGTGCSGLATSVPEPSMLACLGLGALAVLRRRVKRIRK